MAAPTRPMTIRVEHAIERLRHEADDARYEAQKALAAGPKNPDAIAYYKVLEYQMAEDVKCYDKLLTYIKEA